MKINIQKSVTGLLGQFERFVKDFDMGIFCKGCKMFVCALRAVLSTAVRKLTAIYSLFACVVYDSPTVGYFPFSVFVVLVFFSFSPTRRVWHHSTHFSLLLRRTFSIAL